MKIPSVEHICVYPPFTCSGPKSWPGCGNSRDAGEANQVTCHGLPSGEGPNHSKIRAQKSHEGSAAPAGMKATTRASPPRFLQRHVADPALYAFHTFSFRPSLSYCLPVVASRSAASSSAATGSDACQLCWGLDQTPFARFTNSPNNRGSIYYSRLFYKDCAKL